MTNKRNVCLYLDSNLVRESQERLSKEFITLSSKVNALLKEYLEEKRLEEKANVQ